MFSGRFLTVNKDSNSRLFRQLIEAFPGGSLRGSQHAEHMVKLAIFLLFFRLPLFLPCFERRTEERGLRRTSVAGLTLWQGSIHLSLV